MIVGFGKQERVDVPAGGIFAYLLMVSFFGTSGCLHTSEPIIDSMKGCKCMFAEWTQRLYLRVFLEEHRDEFSVTAKRI